MLNVYKIRDWAYLLLRGRETIAERKRVKGTLRRAGVKNNGVANCSALEIIKDVNGNNIFVKNQPIQIKTVQKLTVDDLMKLVIQ